MSRNILGMTAALACALGLAAHAQETKTEIKGAGQQVTYTGCVQNGAAAQSYILDKVVPVSRTRTTEEVGTSGVVTETTTRYELVPDEKVTLNEQLGHKVEVTGLLIPAGVSKTESKTKIETESGKDSTIRERSKTNSDLPQFHVMSVRQLAERCE